MATVTQQEVAPLHKQLNITITKEDYLPQFEKSLREYSRKANIPGFRKGMVPAGLIRKMYGNSLLTDEVLRTVDKEVFRFLEEEKLDIFAQPLPVDLNLSQIDINFPNNYTFVFEVGMKPEFSLPDLASHTIKYYKVQVTDQMVEEEVERLRTRHGNMTAPESITDEKNILQVVFSGSGEGNQGDENQETHSVLLRNFTPEYRERLMGLKTGDSIGIKPEDAFEEGLHEKLMQNMNPEAGSGRAFTMTIQKIGLLEPRALDEELFAQMFPGQEIKTEEEFRERLRAELRRQWDEESRNQLHHTIYHTLLDNTSISFPEDFLRRWLKQQDQTTPKSQEEIEKEFPQFLNRLKWSLITDRIALEHNLKIDESELRQFAKQQLLGYMGMEALDEEQQWVRDYLDRMMKDSKYLEDAYRRVETDKLFAWAENMIKKEETPVSREEFIRMNQEHQHQHH